MIKLTVTGQTLSVATQKVVSGTHDYLEVELHARTPDWENLRKWVHFIKDELHYIYPFHDDRVSAEQHVDLTAGTWEVYVHGNYSEDDDVVERVTTEIRYLLVEGPHDGHPFPELSPDLSEVLANDVERALDIAQGVRDDADAGEFDGATFLPEVSEEGIIRWTNDQGKPNPEPRNIKGPKGDVGDTTVQVSVEEPTDPRINVWLNPMGLAGKVIMEVIPIVETHTPGTYDRYLVKFSDDTEMMIPVYNGADGDGSGDMLKAVYDPDNIAEDVYEYAAERAAEVVDTTGVTGLLKGNGSAISAAVPGTDYQLPLTIDTAMRGDSTNPVQNKVIKAYADERDRVFPVTYGVTTYAQITSALSAGKMPVLYGTYFACPLSSFGAGGYVFTNVFSGVNGSAYRQSYRVNSSDAWSSDSVGTQILLATDVDAGLNSSSINPVQNKAVYAALQGKQDKLTIDTAMSDSSLNPVQNRTIKQYVDSKAGGFRKKVYVTPEAVSVSSGARQKIMLQIDKFDGVREAAAITDVSLDSGIDEALVLKGFDISYAGGTGGQPYASVTVLNTSDSAASALVSFAILYI